MSVESEILNRVQAWYASQCDGDWEHTFGIKIDTLDNPGWWVVVDLRETQWSSLCLDRDSIQRSDSDWFQFEVTGEKFLGGGGAGNLTDVLEAFLRICR